MFRIAKQMARLQNHHSIFGLKVLLLLILFQSFNLWVVAQETVNPPEVIMRLGKGGIANSNSVQFSPDGNILAVASAIGVWLYNTQTLKETGFFEYAGGITGISFSPDGRTLALNTSTHNVAWGPRFGKLHALNLMDTTTGGVLHELEEPFKDGSVWGVDAVSFSPNGKVVATAAKTSGGDKSIILWDAATRKILHKLNGHEESRIKSLSFSPDGKTLASSAGTVILWDVKTGNQLRKLKGINASFVSFSPDGKILALGGETIILWDVMTERIKNLYKFEDRFFGASCLSFSPDGKVLAVGNRDGIILLDIKTGEILHRLDGHITSSWVSSVSFSPDGKVLASVGLVDNTPILWDVMTAKILHRFEEHMGSVNSVSFSPDGKILASAGESFSVRLWDATTGRFLRRFEIERGVTSISFSPDGRILALGGETIILWDVITGEVLTELDLGILNEEVNSLSFSPDGTLLAAALRYCGTILWDIKTGKILHKFIQGIGVDKEFTCFSNYSVSFSPDGKTIAMGGLEVVILWDVMTKTMLRRFEGHSHRVNVFSVAFSPDGKVLASGGADGTLILWDVMTGKILHTLKGRYDEITSISFSSDGKILASVHSGQEVILWETTTGDILYKLNTKLANKLIPDIGYLMPTSVSFSPDGKTIALGRSNGIVLIWNVDHLSGILSGIEKEKASIFGTVINQNTGNPIQGVTVQVTLDGQIKGSAKTENDGKYKIKGLQKGTYTVSVLVTEYLAPKLRRVTFNTVDGTVQVDFALIPITNSWDVNGDGVVNILDLVLVGKHFGERQPADARADVNQDGVVDISDLVLVAQHFGEGQPPAAPGLTKLSKEQIAALQSLYREIEAYPVKSPEVEHLRRLLASLLVAQPAPKTALFANYPNPFNPETWIPYQLAADTDVTLTIYNVAGQVVRALHLGYQPAGYYISRDRAAYWDGRNDAGERVANGVYFYRLQTKNFSATRRMVILK